ncbi:unnamed protein product [Linum trigynum]
MLKRYFLLLNLVSTALLLSTIHGQPLTPEAVLLDEQEAVGSVEEHVDVTSRFLLAQKVASAASSLTGRRKTCDKFPAICSARGSPGPHCCKKKCVDVMRDPVNCGKCGRKCKYSEICCRGRCVNPSFDRSHCGGCGNKCSAAGGGNGKRGFCAFGLCNYA